MDKHPKKWYRSLENRVRILFLCQHFPPETGAPQIRLYEVSKELIKQGYQVEVVTAFPHHPHGIIPEKYRGMFYQFEEWDGIPVHRSWIYPSPKGSFWRRLTSYFSFVFSSMYAMTKTKRTDVVVCVSPPLFLGITGWLSAKFKRAKFVFNVADVWPESAVELGIVKNKTFIKMAERLEKFLYKRAWKIACATTGICQYMINKGKKVEDVFLLPNGVNTDFFQPMPKDKELMTELDLDGKMVFTYAGAIGYAQGLDSIIRAAVLLQEEHSNVHFLFVGDGQEREKLEQLKIELNANNVTIYGSVKLQEMPRIFSITDYSIVSLRNIELFKGARPSKIFPALSTKTPVLYCGVGESAEIIEQTNCGKVAPPENPEGIAQVIREVVALSSDEYETMCINGRKLAISEYSWITIVKSFLSHIDIKEKVRG